MHNGGFGVIMKYWNEVQGYRIDERENPGSLSKNLAQK